MKQKITLVVDDQRDTDILEWLNQQSNRSQAIRQAIRAWMSQDYPESVAGLDVPTLRQVLREELARVAIDHEPGVLDNPLSGAEDEETTEMLESLLGSWDLA